MGFSRGPELLESRTVGLVDCSLLSGCFHFFQLVLILSCRGLLLIVILSSLDTGMRGQGSLYSFHNALVGGRLAIINFIFT